MSSPVFDWPLVMLKQLEKNEALIIKSHMLNQNISGAGKGRRVCLVSDSRVNLAPTADQLARLFVADGWVVTFLDLNREGGSQETN